VKRRGVVSPQVPIFTAISEKMRQALSPARFSARPPEDAHSVRKTLKKI
jgi:hypothetical protein